jgi:acyl-CoA synthetase (AMP-forming)/AMP-acid ligase II
MNIGGFLTTTAALYPGRTALTFEGRSLSYRELDRRVDALAQGLTRLGLVTGDRVVLWLNNCPEFIETFFACWKLGLVAVPVNARLTSGEVAFHADDCGAAAMVYGPEFAADPEEIPVAHHLSTGQGGAYGDLIARNSGATGHTCPLPDSAPAWLFYTSGTTGRPKGATLTHGNLTFVAVSWCADLQCLQPEDVVLHCAPLSHGAGFHALVAIARGAKNVIHPRFDPAAVFEDISRHRVTSVWLVPTQIRLLLDDEGLGRAGLSSLEAVIYGGSPMYLDDLKEAVTRIGPIFCQLYGQGESPMTITYLRRQEHRFDRPDAEVLTSAGVARTGMEVRIADDEDQEVATGETGEIQVRGPAVMAAYWGRPDATGEALRGGWLHTGDLGRKDGRGIVYVLDRLKDLIITGGTNVYAREVEDTLAQHPKVREAAVFGLPHRVWGEAVTAVVVGDSGLSATDALEFCRGRLAGYKCPKEIYLVEHIPKSAYGKVLKRELRQSYAGRGTPAR